MIWLKSVKKFNEHSSLCEKFNRMSSFRDVSFQKDSSDLEKTYSNNFSHFLLIDLNVKIKFFSSKMLKIYTYLK